jgi:hypothetical protein
MPPALLLLLLPMPKRMRHGRPTVPSNEALSLTLECADSDLQPTDLHPSLSGWLAAAAVAASSAPQ